MNLTIESFVGNTPLVKLQRIPGHDGVPASTVILSKLEGNNPAGSVKDRPAMSMISRAEARGEIRPGDTLIEATSGNTGIALAMAAAIKGYRMVIIMPEHLSIERRQTMRAFGAELVLTPQKIGKLVKNQPTSFTLHLNRCVACAFHANFLRRQYQLRTESPHRLATLYA